MPQKEALLIIQQLVKPVLKGFNTSKLWLEYFKKAHGIREYHINKEGQDVPMMTVKAWLERLPNIAKDYEQCNQWNMDELGLFFETLPNKGFVKKKKCLRREKQGEKRMIMAVLVATDGLM